MPQSATMNDRQKVPASLTIKDLDGQVYAALPQGSTVVFESSNPAVADFEEDETGLAGIVTSGVVGTAVITGTVTLPDGRVVSDTLSIAVTNSDVASANFTVGEPQDE